MDLGIGRVGPVEELGLNIREEEDGSSSRDSN